MVRKMIIDKYDNVEITYIDISDPEVKDYPKVQPHIKHPGTPLPIVAFNGEPKWAGSISFHHIIQELQRLGVV
ncbi:MAG: hypothetical protein H0Z35_03105 [Thermoanaerobacteraceae bacterium]|nr:hypothetical protein [Thermoanaerobacteraceae bacterium]